MHLDILIGISEGVRCRAPVIAAGPARPGELIFGDNYLSVQFPARYAIPDMLQTRLGPRLTGRDGRPPAGPTTVTLTREAFAPIKLAITDRTATCTLLGLIFNAPVDVDALPRFLKLADARDGSATPYT